MKRAWVFVCVAGLFAADLAAGWRTYEQTVELTFATPEAAARAQLAPLPLPPGKTLAFSSRWDDTNKDHARMVDALTARGYKGTFYLNQVDAPYADTVIRKMLAKGCSVGTHTVHHPHLPKLPPNAIFKEILSNRIALEAAGDTCVAAFTLPFCDFKSPADPGMPKKISDCLLRAGLLGGPEYWPDVASLFGQTPHAWIGAFTFSINDRDPQLALFEKNVKKGLETIGGKGFECGPHLTLGIHTWQGSVTNFSRFGEIIATTAGRPDWWYCNENEYIAYRMQVFHGSAEKKSVSGKTAVFTVKRPVPFELGDRVALGLRAVPAPLAASLGGQALSVAADGAFLLPHDAGRQLPARVVAVANAGRAGTDASLCDTALPGLQLALHASLEKNLLTCSLRNASGADLKDVCLTFRVPPKWKTGVVDKDLGILKAGTEQRVELALGEQEGDPAFDAGDLYFAVQCDFADAQGAARAYATTEISRPPAPAK